MTGTAAAAPHRHFECTPRTTMTRTAELGRYDRHTIYSILDEALFVTVAAVIDAEPVARPLTHVRIEDDLVLHGHRGSRFLAHLGTGAPICVGAVLIDGLVFGRAIRSHGFNYRSVIVHGRGEPVIGETEKLTVLRRLFDHLTPDRWDLLPRLEPAYVAEIAVIRIPLVECVAKVREGMPDDDGSAPRDPAVWAGVVPLSVTRGPSQGD